MIFFLDLGNKERYKLLNNILGSDLVDVKDLAKAVKLNTTNERLQMDIKNLGILEVDDVCIDYGQRSAIFKCSLIYDYRIDKIGGGSG